MKYIAILCIFISLAIFVFSLYEGFNLYRTIIMVILFIIGAGRISWYIVMGLFALLTSDERNHETEEYSD